MQPTTVEKIDSKKLRGAIITFVAGQAPDLDRIYDIAKKYAGIVSLQLKDYDKAIYYFTSLENQAGLYSNPGKFYHAVTLLKRNKTGDEDEAKELLKQVTEKSLEGSDDAAKWLKKM